MEAEKKIHERNIVLHYKNVNNYKNYKILSRKVKQHERKYTANIFFLCCSVKKMAPYAYISQFMGDILYSC